MAAAPQDRVSRAALVIVCGLPGSGKTTLATRLARERRAVRLCADHWMEHLGISLWDLAGRERVERLQRRLVPGLLAAGSSVVVEWGSWIRSDRDRLREQALELGASVELRYLDAPDDELWRRISARGREKPAITLDQVRTWRALFEAPTAAELALYRGGAVPDRMAEMRDGIPPSLAPGSPADRAAALRERQRPLKAGYREDPTTARMTSTARAVVDQHRLTATIPTVSGEIVAGLHPATGGNGTQTCSADIVLQALVACAGVTLASVATAMSVELRSATVTATGTWDARGTLGVDRDTAVGLTAIELVFELDTDADAEQVARLLSLTERYCVIAQTLAHPPEVSIRRA